MNLGQAFCKAPIFGLFFGSPVFPVGSHQASTTTHLVNLKPLHSVSSTPGFPHKMLALTSPGKCTGGFTPDCIHQISIMNVPCCCNMLQVLVHRWGEGERPPVDLVAASIIFTGSWWSADSTRAEQWGQGKLKSFEEFYNWNVFIFLPSRLSRKAHSKATATAFTIINSQRCFCGFCIYAEICPYNASVGPTSRGSLVSLRTGNLHISQLINARHTGQTFQYKLACSSWSTGRIIFAPLDSRNNVKLIYQPRPGS